MLNSNCCMFTEQAKLSSAVTDDFISDSNDKVLDFNKRKKIGKK